MKAFNQFERKFRKYAIPNLMYYLIILYAVGLVVQLLNPMFYWLYLSLDAQAIVHGQIWRLVTFLVFPPALGNWTFDTVLIGVIALFMYYNLGQTLEAVWGSFRFNVFVFMGIIGQILATFISYFMFQQPVLLTTGYLNLAIFLAFTMHFPEATFYMFFVLPVKAKWLGIAEAAVCVYAFIEGNAGSRCAIVLALANVLIYFLMTRSYQKYSPKEIKRKQEFKNSVKIVAAGKTHHKCAVCGRTEKDGDDLEFRYCSKCAGNYEYCQDHLYTHKHVTKDNIEN